MKVKFLRRTSNEIDIEIEGEGHTFCNLLQEVLLEDDTIDMAGYDIPHPLTSTSKIYVRTKGRREPETAVREAVERVMEKNQEFRESFEKALRAWQENVE